MSYSPKAPTTRRKGPLLTGRAVLVQAQTLGHATGGADNAALGVSHSGQTTSDAQEHGFKADLKMKF